MSIRKFERKDSEAVNSLILSILTNEYPFDKKAYFGSDLDHIAETYAGKRDTFLVLDIDAGVRGTIGVKEESQESALIRRFYVATDFRKKGHGVKLMSEALNFCKEKGYKHAVFQGTSRMIQAIELCKKMKFIERERIDMGGFFIYKFVLDF